MKTVIYIKGKNWDDLRSKFYEAYKDVHHAQDTVVAKTAATARPKAFEIENEALSNRHGTEHYKTGITKKGEPFKKKYKSVWDSKGKYWISEADRRQKMMQFSFENSASRYMKHPSSSKYRPYIPGAKSEVAFFSRVANLWENDTKPYSKRSPYFGANGKTGIWKKGQVRKGKKYFMTKVFDVIDESISSAIKKTEEKVFTREKGYE